MRKFFIPFALLTAVAVAAPASAQRGFDNRFDNMAQQIERASQTGQITNHHARALHRGLRNIDRAERNYMRDGYLTRRERAAIHAKFQSLRSQLQSARRYARNDRRYSYRDDRRWDY